MDKRIMSDPEKDHTKLMCVCERYLLDQTICSTGRNAIIFRRHSNLQLGGLPETEVIVRKLCLKKLETNNTLMACSFMKSLN